MSKITNFIGLFVAISFLASPALAQEVPEHGIFILNSLLFLVAGFLVMFMACGFCMLEAGLVRSKKLLGHLNEISVVDFDHSDVVRHPLVSKIVKAYSNND